MSTEEPSVERAAGGLEPRRLALVLAEHSAASGAPPGIAPEEFAAACLADTYEVLVDLVSVESGIVGSGPDITSLLWPGALQLEPADSLSRLLNGLAGDFDEVVMVPGDVPDLPGLVLAKVFKALQHADVCVAPERAGDGCVAIGVRLPWAVWIPDDLDLDHDPSARLRQTAPRRNVLASGPDWHRLRTPLGVQRLDPGLEGWEQTRALLSGQALTHE